VRVVPHILSLEKSEMAQPPPFFRPECDLLARFLPHVRCLTFGSVRQLLDADFREHFPPDNRSRDSAGWNRHCNLATRHHIQRHLDAGDLQAFTACDHGRIPPLYSGEWFESSRDPRCDPHALAQALILDLKDVRKVEDEDVAFYATQANSALTSDSHRKDGRSEFVNHQFALASFKLFLDSADDPRLRRMAQSWRLLELPDDFDSYQRDYRGDATVETDIGPVVICSPTIPGWWTGSSTVAEFLQTLPQRIEGEHFILLSMLGFMSWCKKHKHPPWALDSSTSVSSSQGKEWLCSA